MSTTFNDGNEYHYILNADEYASNRRMYEYRVTSGTSGKMLLDKRFEQQRALMQPKLDAMLYYHKPDNKTSPEHQGNLFSDKLGSLAPNEMVMLDTEDSCELDNYADFTRRWLAVVEDRLQTWSWVYVPGSLKSKLPRSVTEHRIVKAPRYSGNASRTVVPDWPHDVHQFTDKGPFPGANGVGDTNFTELSIPDMLARCKRVRRSRDPWDTILGQFGGW